MPLAPNPAHRLLHNDRLRTAQTGDRRDIGGALAIITDAPIPNLNCLTTFTTTTPHLDATLDLGFAFLRAFDRPPAAEITPFDLPPAIPAALTTRGLRLHSSRTWMALKTAAPAPVASATIPNVAIRRAGPADVIAFGNLHGGSDRALRRLSKAAMLDGLLDPPAGGVANAYYLALADDQPVATLHLLRDAITAGIYAVTTTRAQRNRGIATALITRAIADARNAGCDLIGLSTASGSPALHLYTRLGFIPLFESHLYLAPQPPVTPSKIRRRRPTPNARKR